MRRPGPDLQMHGARVLRAGARRVRELAVENTRRRRRCGFRRRGGGVVCQVKDFGILFFEEASII